MDRRALPEQIASFGHGFRRGHGGNRVQIVARHNRKERVAPQRVYDGSLFEFGKGTGQSSGVRGRLDSSFASVVHKTCSELFIRTLIDVSRELAILKRILPGD